MNKVKLVMFDMDGTLLDGRGIFVIAEKFGFIDELWALIRNQSMEYYQKSIEVAKLSRGYEVDDYLKIFRDVKLQNQIVKVLKKLKEKNIVTAIATDSYSILANDLKNRLDIDYAFANNLIFNDGIITGELKIHNRELVKDFISGEIYSICKSCVLEQLCDELGFSVDESIAIGDGKVDAGMIKRAGLGIAYKAPDDVNQFADLVTNDLSSILEYI